MEKIVYPLPLRIIHAGLAIFGVCAYLTGELAGEAEHALTMGYWLHAYLGLTVSVFLFSYILLKIVGLGSRPSNSLSTKESLYDAVKADIRGLMKFNLPERADHNGLALMVQLFGVLIFLWMSVTGIILFFMGGAEASSFAHDVAELHEVGESLIPVFLVFHVGAVILHTLLGHGILRRMSPFTKINN